MLNQNEFNLPKNCTIEENDNEYVITINRYNQDALVCYVKNDEYDGVLEVTDDCNTHDLAWVKQITNKQWNNIVKNVLPKYDINCLEIGNELIHDLDSNNVNQGITQYIYGIMDIANSLNL